MKAACAVVLLVLAGANVRAHARGRYELRAAKVSWVPQVGYTETGFDLRLWDHVRRRALWKRRVRHYERTWSRDGRALCVVVGAIYAQSKNDNTWRVLVWREGFRLRNFGVPDDWDYTMGTSWSPDNRRLLILCGGSGDADGGTGKLYCLKLGRWPCYKLWQAVNGVRAMVWKNRRTVIYWPPNDNAEQYKPPPPRLWRAP